MSQEIYSVVGGEGGLPGKLVNQGYQLPPDLPFGDWQRAGLSLRFLHRNINWAMGDWLVYGEATYGEAAYQATMAGMAEMLGRETDSIGQCAWVASRFPPPTRVRGLSWSHHRAVLIPGLSPEDAQDLLVQALGDEAEGPWSVVRLAERAAELAAVIEAQASGGSSEPDLDGEEAVTAEPWLPGAEDLTDEARAACEQYAKRIKVKPLVAARVWACAMLWADRRDAFTRWSE